MRSRDWDAILTAGIGGELAADVDLGEEGEDRYAQAVALQLAHGRQDVARVARTQAGGQHDDLATREARHRLQRLACEFERVLQRGLAAAARLTQPRQRLQVLSRVARQLGQELSAAVADGNHCERGNRVLLKEAGDEGGRRFDHHREPRGTHFCVTLIGATRRIDHHEEGAQHATLHTHLHGAAARHVLAICCTAQAAIGALNNGFPRALIDSLPRVQRWLVVVHPCAQPPARGAALWPSARPQYSGLHLYW